MLPYVCYIEPAIRLHESLAPKISGVLPGKHTLEVWHEFLGPITMPIDVPHKGNISVIVEYPYL